MDRASGTGRIGVLHDIFSAMWLSGLPYSGIEMFNSLGITTAAGSNAV